MARIIVKRVRVIGWRDGGAGPDDPYAHAGWTFAFQDPAGMRYKLDEAMAHDALLLGRVTYEGVAQAWPGGTDEIGFADKMNTMPKYVVSSTLERADWNNSTIISGQVSAEVARLKDEREGDILSLAAASLSGP